MPNEQFKAPPAGTIAAVIVAAGSGSRFGGSIPKQYQPLAGLPLLVHTVRRFATHPAIGRVLVAIDPRHGDLFEDTMREWPLAVAVAGGADRQASVRAALEHLSAEAPDHVVIQDGARPLTSSALISRVIDAAIQDGAAIPVAPVSDTLVRSQNGYSGETVAREALYRVQTPQAFRYPLILAAHRALAGQAFTDDAGLARAAGHRVRLVEGEESNVKITHREDIRAAEHRLMDQAEPRTGQGYDVHRLSAPSPEITALRLGGIDIPFDRRLIGHSDADVALHAVTDALLGALGEGDIGQHFPPSDNRWKGVDSAYFLAEAGHIADQRGARITHIDVTLICQHPRIGPHRAAMVERIAAILSLDAGRVNVKATTTEGLGFTGRGEGIAAMASVSLLVVP